MDLFKLLGTIAIDNKDANKALDETSNKGEQSESKLKSAFSKMGSAAVKVGKVIGTGMVAGGAAMGTLAVKALNLSGELEQNMGGSEAVFGKYADKMQDKAKEAYANMGLSTSNYLATANKMGALFQGAGFDIEESMNLSSSAMQRAADVASIMGLDTSAAMEAVAGAAKGNFTMMDNLGVAMNDTTLNAYALEKGIGKTTQEMTNQEKIGLAMELFMKKTAYAAGNYAKENETLAGSLGTAKAALTNFLDGSGDVDSLVNSFKNAATVIVGSLTEILPKLTTGLTEIVQQLIPLLPLMLQQLLPAIITGATGLITGIVTILPQLIETLTTSVIPQLLTAFVTVINALVSALPQFITAIVSALPTLIPQLVTGLVSMIVTLCSNFAQIIQPLIDYLPEIIISLVNALLDNLPALIQGCIQLVAGIIAAIPQIISALWEAIKGIFTSIKDRLVEFFEPVKQTISNAWKALGSVPGLSSMKTMIENVWGQIKTNISTFINVIKNVITTAWNSIKNVVSTVINSIKNVISTVWNTIKTIISSAMKIISSVLKGDWQGVKNTISNVVNSIKNTISNVFNSVKNTVGNIFNSIKEKMSAPIEKARDTIKGIIDKIKGFFSGMNLSFPNIKMPHFSVSPSGWKIGDLLQGSIPKLGISWYAKAMNNPMVMKSPTIFGYDPNSGKLMGGGEAGSEIVSGTNTLMDMISTAVSRNSEVQTEKLVVILTAVLEAILGGNNEIVQAIREGKILKIGEREFARTVREHA